MTTIKDIIFIFIVLICIWSSITNMIYSFKYPDKTSTQIFLHIHKSLLLDLED
jgi:hypothetical protein